MTDNNKNLMAASKSIADKINQAGEKSFFPFLELPGELRNKIYSLILINDYPGCKKNDMGHVIAGDLACYHDKEKLAHRQATRINYKTLDNERDCFVDTTYSVRHSKNKGIKLELMSVNRQIRAETLPLVFESLRFTVHEFAAIPFLKDLSCLARKNISNPQFCIKWYSCGPNTHNARYLRQTLRFLTQNLQLNHLILAVDYTVCENPGDVDESEKQDGWLEMFNAMHVSEAPQLDIRILLCMRVRTFRLHAPAHQSEVTVLE